MDIFINMALSQIHSRSLPMNNKKDNGEVGKKIIKEL